MSQHARESDGASVRLLIQATTILVGTSVLLWPAFSNGYPLTFQDSGWYLVRLIGAPLHSGRAIGYPFFASWVTFGDSLWPIVVAQALVTSALVVRVTQLALTRGRGRALGAGLALLTIVALSGLPKYASWIMADIMTGWIFLSGVIWLLARGMADRVGATVVLALAVVSHNSHPPLVLGMTIVVAVGAIWARRSWRAGLREVRGLIALGVASIAWVPLANVWAGEPASLFRGGDSIVLYRFIDSGVAVETLDAYCEERDWVSCRYRYVYSQHIGKADGWFLFRLDSPFFSRMNQWQGREQGEIVAHAFRCCWPSILMTTLGGAWEQFWRIDSLDGLAAIDVQPALALLDGAGWNEREALLASRQARDLSVRVLVHPVPERLLHAVLLLVASTLACVAWRRGDPRPAWLVGAVVLFLAGNALICSFGSSIHDRYQGRIAWLLPWAALLAAFWLHEGRTSWARDGGRGRELATSGAAGAGPSDRAQATASAPLD